MSGLWRNNPETKGGKYLVQRRDGTVPQWPHIVLGARDPAAPVALRAYADRGEKLGFDSEYIEDIRKLACDFEDFRKEHGEGDPDAPRHRVDDPAVTSKMNEFGS